MKKFKKKIYLGLVVGVSMFGFMAHTGFESISWTHFSRDG